MVAVQLDGDLLPTSVGAPFDLVWPLDGEALEGLRWYLEDYLQAPYGVYGERGPSIRDALAGWGEAVFGAVFPQGPARDAFLQVRAREGVPTEVVFRSDYEFIRCTSNCRFGLQPVQARARTYS